MNSYLQISLAVLRKSRQPMSSREILEAAYRLQLVPEHLFGKTQHKTLHARLSEDILHNRESSLFTRSAPGRFALRTQLVKLGQSNGEYIAPRRSYQLKHFDVICADSSELSAKSRDAPGLTLFAFVAGLFRRQVPLRLIEQDPALVHLRLLVIIHNCDRILTLAALDAAGLGAGRSFGLLGYVKSEDADLFSDEAYGIDVAAWRTMAEQSTLRGDADKILSKRHGPKGFRCIHVEVSNNYSSTLVVLAEFDCHSPEKLMDQIPSHRVPRWVRVPAEINDLSTLEPVSRRLAAAMSAETNGY